jgi:hypothetical protein
VGNAQIVGENRENLRPAVPLIGDAHAAGQFGIAASESRSHTRCERKDSDCELHLLSPFVELAAGFCPRQHVEGYPLAASLSPSFSVDKLERQIVTLCDDFPRWRTHRPPNVARKPA